MDPRINMFSIIPCNINKLRSSTSMEPHELLKIMC